MRDSIKRYLSGIGRVPGEAKDWKPVPLTEWLDWVDTVQDKPWLLKGLLQSDSLVMLTGEEKTGKTFFAFAIAMCLASGCSRGPFNPTNSEGVPVLILEEEGGRKQTAQRIRAICRGMNIPLERAARNILWSHAENVLLDDDAWQARVRRMVEHYDIRLVVVDTVAQTMAGDENDKANVQRTLNFYKSLKSLTGVMYLHHCKKAAMSDVKDGDVVNIDHQYRGSSALGGAYDQHFGFRQLPDREYIDLYVKAKDHAPKHFAVRAEFVTVPHPDPEEEPILDKWYYTTFEPVGEEGLQEFDLDLAAATIIRGFSYSITELTKLWRVSPIKAKEALAHLVSEGTVEKTRGDKWRLTEPPGGN